MTPVRDKLLDLALPALVEIAEGCGRRQYPRSLFLRFTLAWLYHAAGKPERKWVYDKFWSIVTSPLNPSRPMDDGLRFTGATSCINGMLHDLDIPPTHDVFVAMRAIVERGAGEC